MEETAEVNMNYDPIIDLTADIVAAYVGNNMVPSGDLPGLITAVHQAMQTIQSSSDDTQEEIRDPAVPVKKSITPDFIVCLEDGKKFKSLKRHLRTHYNLSPQEYREKWGLPADYPMVAPNYAKARSELAKKMGLGRGLQKRGRRPKS